MTQRKARNASQLTNAERAAAQLLEKIVQGSARLRAARDSANKRQKDDGSFTQNSLKVFRQKKSTP
jgi:hypothetical protein